MYRFYLAVVDMLPGALILSPVYLALNKVYFHNTGKSILYYLFSCYLAVVYVLVGLPSVTYLRPEPNLNLIPIIGLVDDWKNSVLNVLFFIPLGMSMPILWSRFRTGKRTVLIGFCASTAIELLQILTYRVTDVNDVITNTLGAYLGFLCSRALLKRSARLADLVNENNTSDLYIVVTVVVVVMFFVYPFVSSALWDMILS